MTRGHLGIRRGLFVVLGVVVLAGVLAGCGPVKRAGQRCGPRERDMWAHVQLLRQALRGGTAGPAAARSAD